MTAHEIDGPVAVLCEELRSFARARSPLGVTSGSLPALEALADTGVGAGDLDAVHALIERARASLPRREAAAVALLFADDDDRWQRNLTERMTLAGGELGFRYDTFRRRSGTDRPDSHYDVLLALLAEALLETAIAGPAGVDAGVPAGSTGDAAPAAEHDGGRNDPESVARARAPDRAEDRAALHESDQAVGSITGGGDGAADIDGDVNARGSRALVAGLAAAILAAVVLVVVLFGSDDDDEAREPASAGVADQSPDRTLDVLESVPVAGCDVPLGGSMNPVALPDGVESLIAGAFADTGGLEALGCPLRTVEVWDQLWYQEFVGGELPAGRILADPAAEVAVWVDEIMYFHYERSGGGSLQTLGGLPVGADYASPNPLLLLSGGGAMVAHYLGGPAHWVPVEAIAVWTDLGGADGPLGLPMADINFFDGRPRQEWSGGYGERNDDGTIAVELVDAADIADAVAALPRRRNGILRLYDETAYWIDDQGRRRWIPDGETWACLGGADALIEPETAGWVVGAFAPGPNATCP